MSKMKQAFEDAVVFDYSNDSFHLTVPKDNEHRAVIDLEIDGGPYQTLIKKNRDLNGSHYIFNDSYTTVFDIVTGDWFDWDDFYRTDAASDRMAEWGKLRLDRESTRQILHNEKDWFGFQIDSADLFKGADHLFINDGTGLGKTRSALACLADSYTTGPNIVVCPKIAIDGWVAEINTVFPDADYITIVGDANERRQRLQHVTDVDFTIITYDLLIKHIGCRHWQGSKKLENGELDNIFWNAVIADESHRIKNPRALRTRCTWRLSDSAVKRIALSATPITVSPEDLWGQLRFLAPDEFPSLTKFRERFLHMEKNQHGGLDCHGWKELGELHYLQLMGWRTTNRTFESRDVRYAMKDMIIPAEGPLSVRNLELTPMQKKGYEQMEKYLVLALQDWDGQTIAQNHLDMFVKLRQLANGMPVTTDDMKVVGLDVPSNKAHAVRDLIEDVESTCNVVVFAEHSKVAGMLSRFLEDNLNKRVVNIITGATRTETRQAYVDDFQNNDSRVLVCTSGTMSESVSLTNAGLLIFAQEPASMQQFVQCRGRVRRIGSSTVVPVISLRSKGTVEEKLAFKMSLKLGFLKDYLLQMKNS